MEGDVVSSFRESITIEAPPQVVWKLISDIKRHPEFAGPKSITKVIEFEGEPAVGSRWIAHERFGPRSSTRPRR
jgi:Polyketide cyclase / dehydrase and lipid transport.